MSEKENDEERGDQNPSGKRTVVDEIRQRREGKGNETEGAKRSGSRVRTLLLIGLSFIAGYLVGKNRSESNLQEEFSGSEGGPMEIEIHDTDVSSTTESADEGEDEESEAGGDDDGDDEENETEE